MSPRTLTLIGLLVWSLACSSGAAVGQYVTYASWPRLDPATKISYVRGVLDYAFLEYSSDSPLRKVRARGMARCLADGGHDDKKIVEAVEDYHRSYALKADTPMATLVWEALEFLCSRELRDEAQKARVKRSLIECGYMGAR